MPFHAVKLSSRIRAEEIAEYLGARLNPESGYENDVCIHVKPRHLDGVREGDWLDVVDDPFCLRMLRERGLTGVKLIAASEFSYDFLKKRLDNEIVLIPQQHINHENIKREKREVRTCGYIGSPSVEAMEVNNEIKGVLGKLGFDFVTCFDFKTRFDAIDLYRKIDLLVIAEWRWGDVNPIYKFPAKLINAASFGIPTIAFPRKGYMEFEGNYVRASNMDELLEEAQKFRDESYYYEWSNKVAKAAEKYHISQIALLYKGLR